MLLTKNDRICTQCGRMNSRLSSVAVLIVALFLDIIYTWNCFCRRLFWKYQILWNCMHEPHSHLRTVQHNPLHFSTCYFFKIPAAVSTSSLILHYDTSNEMLLLGNSKWVRVRQELEALTFPILTIWFSLPGIFSELVAENQDNPT